MARQANSYIKSFEIDDQARYMVKLKSVGEAVISPAVTLMSEAGNNSCIMPTSCCVVYCNSNIKTNPEFSVSELPLRRKDKEELCGFRLDRHSNDSVVSPKSGRGRTFRPEVT